MDFSIETAELQRITNLLGITAKSNTLDFSGQILMEADKNNTVLFTSTNTSTSITILSDKVKVNKPGSAVLLYSKIKSFVNSFTIWNGVYGTKEFSFIADGSSVAISVNNVHENGKRSKGKLKLNLFIDAGIQKPKPFKEARFVFNSNIFKKAINNIIYAVDPNEVRPFIQGINVTFSDGEVYFACTNALKLSEHRIKSMNKLKDKNYIMTYSFVMGLRRAFGDDTTVFFDVDGSRITAKFDNVCFGGNLVVGHQYPSYKSALEKFSDKIIIDKGVLMDVISPIVDILNGEDNYRLTLEIKDKKLFLYNDEACFDFDTDYDKDFVVDVNGRFLFQSLDAIQDDQIIIKFSDSDGVLVFDSFNFENQKSLIMPIKRREENTYG